MIARSTDTDWLNRLFNHAEIRPWVAESADGDIDLSKVVGNGQNIALTGEFGATVFLKIDIGMYEVHTAILPEGRGKWAKQFAEQALIWMFCGSDCAEVLTRVPARHPAAQALTRAVGFSEQFTVPDQVMFRGEPSAVTVYSLTLQEWWKRQDWAEEIGERFHEWLTSQITSGTPHGNDPIHNRIVGVSLEMAKRGYAPKAVAWYNRWAFAARHRFVKLVSFDPPRIMFDEGILRIDQGSVSLEQVH